MAEPIYDERTFDRMTVLADALDEAGCGDPEILAYRELGGEGNSLRQTVDLEIRHIDPSLQAD